MAVDVLQLEHTGSVRALARVMRGTVRPVLVLDGAEEALVVLSPAAFEATLLGCDPARKNGRLAGVRPLPRQSERAWSSKGMEERL